MGAFKTDRQRIVIGKNLWPLLHPQAQCKQTLLFNKNACRFDFVTFKQAWRHEKRPLYATDGSV